MLTAVLLTLTAFGPPEVVSVEARPIQSPVDWAEGFFYERWGGCSEMLQAELDIDHDGVAELFIGGTKWSGTNGIPWAVFRRVADGYEFLGPSFIRRDFSFFKVLPLADDGAIRLARYWHVSGQEGFIEIIGHDGEGFVTISRETVYGGDSGNEADRRKLDELFGPTKKERLP